MENFFLSDVTRRCFHDGKEYNVGDITRSADGCKTCICLESGSMQCANTQCNNNGKSIHIVSSMFYFNSSLIIMDWFLKLFILFLLGGIMISWSSITPIFKKKPHFYHEKKKKAVPFSPISIKQNALKQNSI